MHIKLVVQYIGTNFFGFQTQGSKRTVQKECETAIGKFFNQNIKVIASGRTDAGVHAAGQVISFLLPQKAEKNINLYKLCSAVNHFLPKDISVCNPELKEKFNARSDAKAKTYIYKCYVSKYRNAIKDDFYRRVYEKPDISAMRKGGKYLIGTHDFTAFCADAGNKNPNRTIYDFQIREDGDEFWFIVRGNGFLKNMVRIMAGTLLEIGTGKFRPSDIETVLNSKDRKKAGHTAPACGLTLHSVEY
jgi:tRNA pseudouridine38-40 synthase